MKTLYGLPIKTSRLCPEYQPKLKIHPSCPMTDLFRHEMDAWPLDMFGEEPLIYMLDTGLGFAMAFFAELSAAQEPLPPDFAKILYENLWDLYED